MGGPAPAVQTRGKTGRRPYGIMRRMQNSRSLVLFIVGLLALLGGVVAASLLLGRGEQATLDNISATYLPGGKPVADFALTDHRGETFTEQDLRGRWSLMFFGFTNCPDVCPTTMATLSQAHDLIESRGGELPQVLFVGVDPQRDRPQLATYVGYFHERFAGLTGSAEQIAGLTRDLGIAYRIHADPDGDGQYGVDHSGLVLLINPQGQFQAFFRDPGDPQRLVDDYLQILDYHQP
jgi:protein SCO1/2